MRLLPVHETDASREFHVPWIPTMDGADTVILHLPCVPKCVGHCCYVLRLGPTEWTRCSYITGAVFRALRFHVVHDVSHVTNGHGEHPDEGHVATVQISFGQSHFEEVAVQFRQPRRTISAGPPPLYIFLHVLKRKRRGSGTVGTKLLCGSVRRRRTPST